MTLSLIDNQIYYAGETETFWTIDIDKIVFIGEYTTSAGPFLDDWFYVFGREDGNWYEATAYAKETDSFWEIISEKLGCKLCPGLASSTNWKTRLMYPEILEDKELFNLIRIEIKPRTFWQKLFGKKFEETVELTDEIKTLFEN